MVHTSSVLSGTYEARRAAALSGVPVSTVYDWARKEFIVPSVSRTREMLWSYADLMSLRIAYWLRHPKDAGEDVLPASPMSEVRRAVDRVHRMGIDLWAVEQGRHKTPLRVDSEGHIWIVGESEITSPHGQRSIEGTLDLLGPFRYEGGVRGPDLVIPRPHLRIVPGKLSGEPHLEHSRISTLTLAALSDRGLSVSAIADMYPGQSEEAISEAIELESDLGAISRAA